MKQNGTRKPTFTAAPVLEIRFELSFQWLSFGYLLSFNKILWPTDSSSKIQRVEIALEWIYLFLFRKDSSFSF